MTGHIVKNENWTDTLLVKIKTWRNDKNISLVLNLYL